MCKKTLAALFSSLLIGSAHAAPDSHTVEVNPVKRVFPDLFSDKSHTNAAQNTATDKSTAKATVSGTGHAAVDQSKKPLAGNSVAQPVVKKSDSTSGNTSVSPSREVAKKSVTSPELSGQTLNVVKTIEAWTAAWSARDADKYLAFYSADFHTPDGKNRAEWETMRRERIAKPATISVQARNITVDFSDESHATVRFHQDYLASNLKSADNKTLLMTKSGDTWLIQEERKN